MLSILAWSLQQAEPEQKLHVLLFLQGKQSHVSGNEESRSEEGQEGEPILQCGIELDGVWNQGQPIVSLTKLSSETLRMTVPWDIWGVMEKGPDT